MLEGDVTNRAIKCSTCGAGPWSGREVKTKTRTEIITECTWICGRCGSKFNSGVINREPIKK